MTYKQKILVRNQTNGTDSVLTIEREKNKAAQALGRLGGKATSDAKTKAVRINAKKGGWPKGKKRDPRPKQTFA